MVLHPDKIEVTNEGDGQKRPLTILYFGTYEETYSRNQIIMKTLERMGHTVKRCHIPLWRNKTDKTKIFKYGFDAFALLIGLLLIYPRLILRYLLIGHYDIVFIGYPGHLDVLIITFLEFISRRKKKVVFDTFISLYDTITGDRGMAKKESVLGKSIFWLDRIACMLADIILLDTQTHINYFKETFRVPAYKMIKIYASADSAIFFSRNTHEHCGAFQVLFVGKYTPLHGIEYIVEAAELLKHQQDIRFTFIGKGQLFKAIHNQVQKIDLKNISFIEWAPYETLPDYIKEADICLGIFSKSAKANRVIPNKIFQAMAMGKPVISGRTSGVLEFLVHGENIYLCEPGNPIALAEGILTLKSDEALRKRIGIKALHTFQEEAGEKAVVIGLTEALKRINHPG